MDGFMFKKEYYIALECLSKRQRVELLDLLLKEAFTGERVSSVGLTMSSLALYNLLRTHIGLNVSGAVVDDATVSEQPAMGSESSKEAVVSSATSYASIKFRTNDIEFEEFCRNYDYFPHLEQSKRGAFTIWNAKCLMLSEKREIIAAASLYNETRGAKMYMVAPAKFLRTNEYKNASNWIKPGKSNRDPNIITADKLMEATINNNKIYKELLRNGQ